MCLAYDHNFLCNAKDMRTAESLQFDLGTLETATNKFSEDNKLGEGGFGAVFKVITQQIYNALVHESFY